MRIDLFNSSASQISNEAGSSKVSAHKSSASGVASGEDWATLTSGSAQVGALVNAAMQTPDVRQGMVDSLRQSVSSGQYELDPTRIAASMVSEEV
jgi:flagellar biosynthesis anti-sigma factor FlgM